MDAFVQHPGFLVLDGGLATALEAKGQNLHDGLWSALLLLQGNLELVKSVHTAYFEGGADVAITASYQASFEGFAKKGCDRDTAAGLIASSIRVAKEARDEFWAEEGSDRVVRPIVAASVGCYGAYLAGGEEYTGKYADGVTVETLMEWHRRRMRVLWDAGPDIFACETIPRVDEAIALTRLLQEFPQGATAWISFVCRDGSHLTSGELLKDAVAAICAEDAGHRVVAIGINCTPPQHVASLLEAASAALDTAAAAAAAAAETKAGAGAASATQPAPKRHLVVYPNSGEEYDAVAKAWVAGGCAGSDAAFGDMARQWHKAGALGIGGCCRTTPDTIAAVRKALTAG